MKRIAIAFLFFATLIPAVAQEEGKRFALIIGNNNYGMSPLKNAVNDARLMDKTLEAAGFRNILVTDATQTKMEEAVSQFLSQIGPEDTALFFYAGHGVQIESENFLVPVDFQATGAVYLAKARCFRIAGLYDALKNRTKRTIVILDACRSNPATDAARSEVGLAQPQITGNETYVAYSTSPGQVAADNPAGRNSYFTEALADSIEKPGITLDDVFTRVKSRVSSETEKKQAPWTLSSLTSTFYFHTPANLKSENDATLAEKWSLEAQRREQRHQWARAIELLNQVLARKPGGSLEALATTKLPYLQARKAAQTEFEAGNINAACPLYEKALELDRFAIDVAFEAANCYLLDDQLPGAIRLLNSARMRGANLSVQKANLMLKELANIDPDARKVLTEGIPPAPSIKEMFSSIRFDSPDWNAGYRITQSSSMPLNKWVKELDALYPPPAEVPEVPASGVSVPVTEPGAAQPPLANSFLHIEVIPAGESRDISLRVVKDDPTDGVLKLKGSSAQVSVMMGNSIVSLPHEMKLHPGKYEIRFSQPGKLSDVHSIEIPARQTIEFNVPVR